MINRLGRQLVNQHRLLRFKRIEQYVQPKRNNWLDNPQPPILYRDIGMKQNIWDWYGSAFFMAFGVFAYSVNFYMNWDELKLVDPPGFVSDPSEWSDKELGIPKDDELGYAPIRKELIKDGKLLDLGNEYRNERRHVYHAFMLRKNLPNPYDM